MPSCGSQIVLCDLPIRFDTYKGCSHFCKYCFAQRKQNLADISKNETVEALKNFISKKRSEQTNWCDWDIPLHWGGLSDPFQPIEQELKLSYECLKLLAETKYPVVISTKGKLICEPKYLELLKECNAVVQISMVCSKYDIMEKGAPTFAERLKMVEILSKNVKRIIIRAQPYMIEIHNDLLKNIPLFKQSGAYGITIEAMKFIKKKPGLIKVGADLVYPLDELKTRYMQIKDISHKNGLKFYCAENRLRALGDNMTCCGIDGLEGFTPNKFNLCRLMNGEQNNATTKMKETGTANCFKAIYQNTGTTEFIAKQSLYDMMLREYRDKHHVYADMFGLKK